MKKLISQIQDSMLGYIREANIALLSYDAKGVEEAMGKFDSAQEVIARYRDEFSWAQEKLDEKIMRLRNKVESNKKLLDDINEDMEWIRVNCCK